MYTNLKAQISTDIEGNEFSINRGVRQGDPVSPLLFNCSLDEIFKKLNWENLGININGTFLNHLKFADDVALVAGSPEDLQKMLDDLYVESKRAGLEINLSKTKVLSNSNENTQIKIGGTILEKVDSIIYLGQLISFENQSEKEINRRIAIAWGKFWKLSFILKQKYPIQFKKQIFNSCIVPAFSYGCQTWTLNKKLEKKIQVLQNSMERAMLNIQLKDKIRISKIKKQMFGNTNLLHYVRRLKWDWAGHVCRLKDQRWTQIITFWQPLRGRRPGKQKGRWMDDITNFTGTKLFHRVATDRAEWARLREAFAQNQGFVRHFVD